MPQYRKGMNRMEEERANAPTERTHNTILIVDDDEMNRAILENIFAAHYQVEEADNGRTGLEKILDGADRHGAHLPVLLHGHVVGSKL